MAPTVYIVTLIFVLLLGELLFAGFGVWIPLSLIGLHYLAYSREFSRRFPIALIFGFVIDCLYLRMFPVTMVCVGIWVILFQHHDYFKRSTLAKQPFFCAALTGFTVFFNLLPQLPAASLDAWTFYSVVSIVTFATVINAVLTPFLFAFFDNTAVWLGIKILFDPYLNHTSTRLRELRDE